MESSTSHSFSLSCFWVMDGGHNPGPSGACSCRCGYFQALGPSGEFIHSFLYNLLISLLPKLQTCLSQFSSHYQELCRPLPLLISPSRQNWPARRTSLPQWCFRPSPSRDVTPQHSLPGGTDRSCWNHLKAKL